MAESENNKPKTEKTSASVTSTLQRLNQNNNSYLKDSSCNIPKLKSRFQGNKTILDEKQKLKGGKENTQINFDKLKLINFDQSDQKSSGENALLFQHPLKDYHGQIPIRFRHSLNTLRMSPIATRSPSPVKKASPKEKVSNKVKIITLEQDTKKKRNNSRSPSPLKTGGSSNIKSKSRTNSTSLTAQSFTSSEKTEEIKFHDKKRPTNSKPNTKSKKSKDKNKEQTKNSTILKQISQPSLPVKDKIQPQEKISLDHLKSEVYSGDHTRLSFEKVQLCIEKSMDNLALKEKKRRYFVTYSSEDARKKAEASVSLLKNISSTSITTYSTESEKRKKPIEYSKSNIKTMSGHELILTPSIKLDIEKGDASEDLEISNFLQENEDSFGNQNVIIPQDETNEYDTEVSTDNEMTIRGVSISSPRPLETKNNDLNRKNALWKSREAELLSDVDYRQSVYHPAVSRRHKNENEDDEYGGKNKSHEDQSNVKSKQSYEGRSHSTIGKNRFTSSSSKQMSSSSNESTWISSFDRTEEKPIYNSVIPAGSFYGSNKNRTKKEKVSGALLHFTLKVFDKQRRHGVTSQPEPMTIHQNAVKASSFQELALFLKSG